MQEMKKDTKFWRMIKIGDSNQCWHWTGAVSAGTGYGNVKRNNRNYGAHVYAFLLGGEKLKKGNQVLHGCDNRICVNPSHLFQGTQKDNIHDCIKKGRHNPGAGERHARAKLNWAKVVEIRAMSGVFSNREIARRYGVTSQAIDKVINQITWKRHG